MPVPRNNPKPKRSTPRTVALHLPDGRRVVCDYPPPFILAAVKRMGEALQTGREPDTEDADGLWRWSEEQERRHPTPAAEAKPDPVPEGTSYPLLPLDMDRVLQPGTVSQLIDLEDSDPAQTLMVEMPLEHFLATRDELRAFVRDQLGHSLLVVLVDAENPA